MEDMYGGNMEDSWEIGWGGFCVGDLAEEVTFSGRFCNNQGGENAGDHHNRIWGNIFAHMVRIANEEKTHTGDFSSCHIQ